MNSLQLQDQSICRLLQPAFQANGYEAETAKNMFRKRTAKGFRYVKFSLTKGSPENHFIDIHFGIRFDIIETLAQQFLEDFIIEDNDSSTLNLSLHSLKNPPISRLVIKDASSLSNACSQISSFMQVQGFRFLCAYDKLKRIDATINRRPQLACPFISNEVHRCFKGIIIARLLHRNDFERLTYIYRNYLNNEWIPGLVRENFNRLVNFLTYFSFN